MSRKVEDKMPLSIDDQWERSKFVQFITLLQWQTRLEDLETIPQLMKNIVHGYFRFIDELLGQPRTEESLATLQEEQDNLSRLLVNVAVQAGRSVTVIDNVRRLE